MRSNICNFARKRSGQIAFLSYMRTTTALRLFSQGSSTEHACGPRASLLISNILPLRGWRRVNFGLYLLVMTKLANFKAAANKAQEQRPSELKLDSTEHSEQRDSFVFVVRFTSIVFAVI